MGESMERGKGKGSYGGAVKIGDKKLSLVLTYMREDRVFFNIVLNRTWPGPPHAFELSDNSKYGSSNYAGSTVLQ